RASGLVLGIADSYDIVYTPNVLNPSSRVVRRGVTAIDRTHALLSWVRTELGEEIDPVEMFEADWEFKRPCGCAYEMRFEFMRRGRMARLTNAPMVPGAWIECEPCKKHEDVHPFDAPTGGYWDGLVTALGHDPRRPDVLHG